MAVPGAPKSTTSMQPLFRTYQTLGERSEQLTSHLQAYAVRRGRFTNRLIRHCFTSTMQIGMELANRSNAGMQACASEWCFDSRSKSI